MKTGSTSTFKLLQWIYITLLSVIKAQEVKVWPEVTGYPGLDVTLHCEFIPGPTNENVTQFQWGLLQGDQKKTIIVFNKDLGVTILKPYVEEKVAIKELSLIIKDLEIADAGVYIFSISTYPSGSFEGTTHLIVKEQMLLSGGAVVAIVIAVILILVILTTTTYLILIKRCDSSVNHVHIDTNSPVIDMTPPSVIKREEDVVYSEVKNKRSRGGTASSRYKQTEDVTYAQVIFLPQQQ